MESPRPDSTMQCWCHLASHGSKERCPCSCGHAHQDGLNPIYYLSPLFVFPITYTRSTPFLYLYLLGRKENLTNNNRDGTGAMDSESDRSFGSAPYSEYSGAGDEITSGSGHRGPRARGQEKRRDPRSRPRSAEYRRMAIGSAPLSLSLSLL